MRSAYLYNFLIEANIMAVIAILLMIPLRRFFRKTLGNSALCFGWLLIAIRLLLPLSLVNPLIHEIRSPFAADAGIRPIAGQIKVRVGDVVEGISDMFWKSENRPAYDAIQRLTIDMENANVSIALAKIWLVGVLLVAAWFLFSNIHFRMRLRADRIEPISGDLLEQYETVCRQRGVKHPLPVYFTDPLPSACLVGVFRPYIALPLSAAPQDAIQVMTHEICHYKNLDHLWGILRLVCCMLHWFNPLVWMAASMSRTDCELRCDSSVTHSMSLEDRKSYASVLVLAASKRNAPGVGVLATGMTMTGKRLKTRILSVVEQHEPLRALSIAFILLASMCLLGAFATSETREQLEDIGWPMPAEHYLTEGIQGQTSIRSEEEATEYAEKLWHTLTGSEPQYDLQVIHNDDMSWYADCADESGQLRFSTSFLANGVVCSLNLFTPEEALLEGAEIIDSLFMDPAEMNLIRKWAAEQMETLNPGSSHLVSEFQLLLMRDTGHTRFVSLHADPRDSHYDCGITMFLQITSEGYRLLEMSMVGNG